MKHKSFFYLVDDAASLEDAEARVAEIIVTQWNYRFPRWWEMSRWYENLSPDFREAVGRVMARSKQKPSKFNGKLDAAVRGKE